MTIHKAKGLEFDTVILPGLGQRGRNDDRDLLVFEEQQGELLLALIAGAGMKDDKIYKYLSRLRNEKTDEETARVLYVAVTRARRNLHLLGCARSSEAGISAESGSFLELLWPAIGHEFTAIRAEPDGFKTSDTKATPTARQIRRLPLNWTLPAHPTPIPWKRVSLEREEEDEVAYEWVGDTARHVGTVLHRFLQRISAEGLERWEMARLESHRTGFRTMLSNLGVPRQNCGMRWCESREPFPEC